MNKSTRWDYFVGIEVRDPKNWPQREVRRLSRWVVEDLTFKAVVHR